MLDKKTKKENFKQIRAEFGEHIRQLRLERNLTLLEISQITGLLDYRIDSYEIGKHVPDWGTLLCLAAFYDKKVQIRLVG